MFLIVLNVIDGLNGRRDGVLSPYDCFSNGRTDKSPVSELLWFLAEQRCMCGQDHAVLQKSVTNNRISNSTGNNREPVKGSTDLANIVSV